MILDLISSRQGADAMVSDNWITNIHPGYKTKTIKVGNSTIEINRPLLDASEQARREREVKDALRLFGKGE